MVVGSLREKGGSFAVGFMEKISGSKYNVYLVSERNIERNQGKDIWEKVFWDLCRFFCYVKREFSKYYY